MKYQTALRALSQRNVTDAQLDLGLRTRTSDQLRTMIANTPLAISRTASLNEQHMLQRIADRAQFIINDRICVAS